MAKAPNSVEKSLIHETVWTQYTRVTDARQTDRRHLMTIAERTVG